MQSEEKGCKGWKSVLLKLKKKSSCNYFNSEIRKQMFIVNPGRIRV